MNALASRAAALALLAAVLTGVWALAIAPLLDRATTLQEDIARTDELVAGFERRVGSAAGGHADFTALMAEIADSGAYLAGDTPGLAAAELQQRLAILIAEEGAEIRSVRALDTDRDDPSRIAVEAAFAGPFEAVIRALYRLEAERPLLMLPKIRLTAGEPDGDDGRLISATVEVAGYRPPMGAP